MYFGIGDIELDKGVDKGFNLGCCHMTGLDPQMCDSKSLGMSEIDLSERMDSYEFIVCCRMILTIQNHADENVSL